MMLAETRSETQSTVPGRGRRESRRTLLVLAEGMTAEHVLPESGTIVIGRGHTADISIDHPSLSRRHARMTLGAHVTIEDCGSRNGTILGGRALSPGRVLLVAPGTAIEIGDVLIVIRAPAGADMLASSEASTGRSVPFERVVARLADTDHSLLVVGEPGSGKSHLARQIHARSRRREGPFVTLRCGYVRDPHEIEEIVGSARDGTLLVHDPGALTPDGQAILGRSIEQNSARIVTVTSRDIGHLVGRGVFSADLLHRLSALSIAVPPLRARLRELPEIVSAILSQLAAKHERPLPLLGSDALAVLGRHSWPGNVRELEAALRRALLFTKSRVLTAACFNLDERQEAAGAGLGTLSSAVSEAEHRRIVEALRQCNGNQTRAAKLLGISRGTLVSRLARYGMPRPRK